MKAQILDIDGKKIKEITTTLFEEPIREDLIYKIVEADKMKYPSSPKLYAGMDRSASGKIRRKRHTWKSGYGRGYAVRGYAKSGRGWGSSSEHFRHIFDALVSFLKTFSFYFHHLGLQLIQLDFK